MDKCPYCELNCIQQWICNECRLSPTQPIDMILETIQLEKELRRVNNYEDMS
jgi:hypothetical protein